MTIHAVDLDIDATGSSELADLLKGIIANAIEANYCGGEDFDRNLLRIKNATRIEYVGGAATGKPEITFFGHPTIFKIQYLDLITNLGEYSINQDSSGRMDVTLYLYDAWPVNGIQEKIAESIRETLVPAHR